MTNVIMESDLIGRGTTKMKAKRKAKKARTYSLSRDALSMEVKQATDLLQLSCNWAFSLSEGVENFQTALLNAIDHLETLVRRTRNTDMSLNQQRKIRSVLWHLRKYSRQMYDGSEPLSVIGIVEDVQMMDDLSKMLENVVAITRQKS